MGPNQPTNRSGSVASFLLLIWKVHFPITARGSAILIEDFRGRSEFLQENLDQCTTASYLSCLPILYFQLFYHWTLQDYNLWGSLNYKRTTTLQTYFLQWQFLHKYYHDHYVHYLVTFLTAHCTWEALALLRHGKLGPFKWRVRYFS